MMLSRTKLTNKREMLMRPDLMQIKYNRRKAMPMYKFRRHQKDDLDKAILGLTNWLQS